MHPMNHDGIGPQIDYNTTFSTNSTSFFFVAVVVLLIIIQELLNYFHAQQFHLNCDRAKFRGFSTVEESNNSFFFFVSVPSHILIIQ